MYLDDIIDSDHIEDHIVMIKMSPVHTVFGFISYSSSNNK
jgi:hypothetical protein